MGIENLCYMEAPLLNGKRLFRGREEVGYVRNEELENFKQGKRDTLPTVHLHPSQYHVEKEDSE